MSDKPQAPPLAVALHYDGGGAPRLVAKGGGEVAERILEVAREHGVPLHEDPALARALARLELGEEIPRALYQAVAEVLAFALRLSGRDQAIRDKLNEDKEGAA
ncbi:MAG: EscU/YscU/HrcU family type III secretion system export apparatus switch protein [Halothiobacillaceae bacterium]|jgi:flagellar biosynthesis protein